MTQRKLKYEEIETLRCYRSWCNRVCEYGLFSNDDSHFAHTQKMIEHGTNDGKPWVEPELTDEDAKRRPWVMCRDDHDRKWRGPYVLVCKTNEKFGFAAALPDFSELTGWCHCRLATPEEIEAANAK
jgi:hypothetical protein